MVRILGPLLNPRNLVYDMHESEVMQSVSSSQMPERRSRKAEKVHRRPTVKCTDHVLSLPCQCFYPVKLASLVTGFLLFFFPYLALLVNLGSTITEQTACHSARRISAAISREVRVRLASLFPSLISVPSAVWAFRILSLRNHARSWCLNTDRTYSFPARDIAFYSPSAALFSSELCFTPRTFPEPFSDRVFSILRIRHRTKHSRPPQLLHSLGVARQLK